jgi:hypothetical protein
VCVPVEAGKVTAGDLELDAVTGAPFSRGTGSCNRHGRYVTEGTVFEISRARCRSAPDLTRSLFL